MKGKKKILSITLAGIMGLSMLTSPVFATAGGAGTSSGETGSITVNYQSLTQGNSEITNKVGPDNVTINTDFGYAWDDLSFTYVQTIGGGESTLTTAEGYNETSAQFISGTWYKGSYSTLDELNAALVNDISLPEISLISAAEPGADVTADQFAKLPKIVLHNYSQNDANFAFDVASEDYSKFNQNGMLVLVNEDREANEVAETTGILSQSATSKFGVTPIGAPAVKDFSPFTVGLTIKIN